MTTCNNCKKEFSTKYTLKRHIDLKICLDKIENSCYCNGCKKEFSNKFSLDRHQKTQNCSNKFECIYCNKFFSYKQRYLKHNNICENNKKDKELEDLKKDIELLKNNKPIHQNITINTNNQTNSINQTTTHNYGSILSLSKEVIKETFDKNYTIEDFRGSQKALADFTNKHFLRGLDNPLYLCVDKSRQKFVFTDEKQQETEDVNAETMIKLMAKGFDKVKNIYDEEYQILQKRLKKFIKLDTSINIIDTRKQIKILEDTYKQLMNIINNSDKYRIQLSKILPSTLEARENVDKCLKQIAEDDDFDCQAELDRLENKKDDNNEEIQTTFENIGGISLGGLRMYKNHFLQTGKKMYHPKHKGNIEFMKQFDEFCETN